MPLGLRRITRCQPFAEGLLGLARASAREEAFARNIRVKIGPVETGPTTDEAAVYPLCRSRVSQTREPGKENCHGATVLQIHGETVFLRCHGRIASSRRSSWVGEAPAAFEANGI